MRAPLPRSVFGQLALVIALVLVGAGVLAVLLGRELATRPAAEQLLRAMQGFAEVVEALDQHQPHARTVAQLRDAGLEVRSTPPADATCTPSEALWCRSARSTKIDWRKYSSARS